MNEQTAQTAHDYGTALTKALTRISAITKLKDIGDSQIITAADNYSVMQGTTSKDIYHTVAKEFRDNALVFWEGTEFTSNVFDVTRKDYTKFLKSLYRIIPDSALQEFKWTSGDDLGIAQSIMPEGKHGLAIFFDILITINKMVADQKNIKDMIPEGEAQESMLRCSETAQQYHLSTIAQIAMHTRTLTLFGSGINQKFIMYAASVISLLRGFTVNYGNTLKEMEKQAKSSDEVKLLYEILPPLVYEPLASAEASILAYIADAIPHEYYSTIPLDENLPFPDRIALISLAINNINSSQNT